MPDFKKMYESKLTTAEEAASRVQSGWLIGTDAAVSVPPALVSAIAARAARGEISGVKMDTLLDAYPYEFYADDSLSGRLTGVSWFSSSGARKAINGGWGDFIPSYYRDIPGNISRLYDHDVFIAEVSPMDKHGYFSLGTVGSLSEVSIDKAERVFVVVNDKQRRLDLSARYT